MISVGILLLVLAGIALVMRQRGEEVTGSEWDNYLNRKLESTERLLGPAARSFSRSGAIARMASPERTPEALRRDLEMGGAFSGNARIYYSMQMSAIVVGAGLLALGFLEGLSGLNRFVLVGIGLIVSIWPYNKVRSEARKKRTLILEQLPEFADLLLMVLSSMTVPQALSFTSERSSGIIAAEMRELARAMATGGSQGPEQAFAAAAGRLGTAEGREFVAALQSSYLDGTRAVDNIRAQTENLRLMRYQQQRAMAKRLPVSLIVTFALHFMPLLFILAFLPVLSSLAGLG